MHFTSQSPHAIRFEWGAPALEIAGDPAGVTIIVDVLSFSTCVDIACARGASVLPYRFKDASAKAYALEAHAILADTRHGQGLSLSPTSLQQIAPGTRLVLPSPNGSTLTLASRSRITLAGCLRNATAVAQAVNRAPGIVTVVACGERWEDGSVRPCIEDLLGAGAIVAALSGSKSAEALVAENAFVSVKPRLAEILSSCASAIELTQRDFANDVSLALEFDRSTCVPQLVNGAYVASKI
jgi:2-phosphosulfolactate phosphatase